MPRYSYYCEICREASDVFHLIGESVEHCPICDVTGSLSKMVSTPTINSKAAVQNTSVKERVVKHIDDAKRDLKLQLEELKNEDLINE